MWCEFLDFSILPIFSTTVQFMLTVRQFSLVLFLLLYWLLYCCVPNLAMRCLLSSRSMEFQVGLADPGLFSWVSRCLWFDWLSCRSRWSLWSASSTGTCRVVSWRSFYTLDFRLDAPSSPIDCRRYSFSTFFVSGPAHYLVFPNRGEHDKVDELDEFGDFDASIVVSVWCASGSTVSSSDVLLSSAKISLDSRNNSCKFS